MSSVSESSIISQLSVHLPKVKSTDKPYNPKENKCLDVSDFIKISIARSGSLVKQSRNKMSIIKKNNPATKNSPPNNAVPRRSLLISPEKAKQMNTTLHVSNNKLSSKISSKKKRKSHKGSKRTATRNAKSKNTEPTSTNSSQKKTNSNNSNVTFDQLHSTPADKKIIRIIITPLLRSLKKIIPQIIKKIMIT